MDQTCVHDIPLEIIATNGNDGATYLNDRYVAADNIDGVATRNVNASETHKLLQNTGTTNGDTVANDVEAPRPYTDAKKSAICKVKEQLNQKVYKKIPMWAVIILIFALIIAVIFISLALCTVIHEDVDEKYDPSTFEVPRYFSGTFRLPNQKFTDELLNLNSSESQVLVTELQNKLDDLYTTSPALGRYFSKSEIYEFGDGSVTVAYKLTFLMPEAEQDQLKRFTLSREMVYNVLKQFLFDQETDMSDLTYIDPASLTMLT